MTAPMMLGSTIGSAVSWRWDRTRMRYEATHGDHVLIVYFHKVGGRWSKTLEDGRPNVHQVRRGYWTAEVDGDHSRRTREFQHATAREAQLAAVAEFKRRYGKAD